MKIKIFNRILINKLKKVLKIVLIG